MFDVFMGLNDEMEICVVTCSTCGFRSPNLTFSRCPNDDTVLGEVVSTIDDELERLAEVERTQQLLRRIDDGK